MVNAFVDSTQTSKNMTKMIPADEPGDASSTPRPQPNTSYYTLIPTVNGVLDLSPTGKSHTISTREH